MLDIWEIHVLEKLTNTELCFSQCSTLYVQSFDQGIIKNFKKFDKRNMISVRNLQKYQLKCISKQVYEFEILVSDCPLLQKCQILERDYLKNPSWKLIDAVTA